MEAHNAVKSQTYAQGVNRSTDLTLEEFQALPIRGYSVGAKSGSPKIAVHEYKGERLADTVKPCYSMRGHSSQGSGPIWASLGPPFKWWL